MHTKDDYLTAWQEKANLDYTAFHVLLHSESELGDIAAFHAQQAVEKWLKALLILNDQDVPKIHNLLLLMKLLAHFYKNILDKHWQEKAALLNNYAVDIRYVDESDPTAKTTQNLAQVEEALLAFRAFAKEKLGAHWVEV
jgi:HEPN domain-containing protein